MPERAFRSSQSLLDVFQSAARTVGQLDAVNGHYFDLLVQRVEVKALVVHLEDQLKLLLHVKVDRGLLPDAVLRFRRNRVTSGICFTISKGRKLTKGLL